MVVSASSSPSPSGEQHFQVVVRDNGGGVSTEALERGTELFYSERGPDGEGPRGVGLSRAKYSALAHGGDLVLGNEGSAAVVKLSFVSFEEPEKDVETSPVPQVSKPRIDGQRKVDGWIAVVDDDEAVAQSVVSMLDELGMMARAFSDFRATRKSVLEKETELCALIVDRQLGTEQGDELVSELEQEGFDRPVFFMSGDDRDWPEHLSTVVGFISKPVERSSLKNALKVFLPPQRSGDV
ncbi:MAG: response regulator [Planctomycetota bacterium]|nr:response regulator [Planctomycetota bacterium]